MRSPRNRSEVVDPIHMRLIRGWDIHCFYGSIRQVDRIPGNNRARVVYVRRNVAQTLEHTILQDVPRKGILKASQFVAAGDHSIIVNRRRGGLNRMREHNFRKFPVDVFESKRTAGTGVERTSNDYVGLVNAAQHRTACARVIQRGLRIGCQHDAVRTRTGEARLARWRILPD